MKWQHEHCVESVPYDELLRQGFEAGAMSTYKWPTEDIVECQQCGVTHCVEVQDVEMGNRLYVLEASYYSYQEGERERYPPGQCWPWEMILDAFQLRAYRWGIFTKGYYPPGSQMEKPTIEELKRDANKACRFDDD